MLTYLNDSFLEIDNEEIVALHRSSAVVTFQVKAGDRLDVQAFLILQRRDEESNCHAAFYCRELKRSLIFAVSAPGMTDPLRHGEAELQRLGFLLTPVNLNLNPALRQVVLRDIPPLRRPSAGGRAVEESLTAALRGEDLSQLGDSPSAISKSMALKLSAQRQLEHKLAALRAVIERQLQPPSASPASLPGCDRETEMLADRYVDAEPLLAAEAARRAQMEEALAAAEKRIQELEDQLVGVETREAGELQLKRKLAAAEKRNREMNGDLKAAADRIKAEEQGRESLGAALTLAQEQLASRERQLLAAQEKYAAALAASEQRQLAEDARCNTLETELTAARGQVSAVSTARDELLEELKAARERIKSLDKALARAAAQQAAKVAAAEAVAMDVTELAGERDRARDLAGQLEAANIKLQKELALAGKRSDMLAKKLREAETALEAGSSVTGQDETSAALVQALADLQGERSARAVLEQQLDTAHQMLESLGKALKTAREAEVVAGGQPEERPQVQKLEAQLNAAEAQMEQERIESRKLARAHLDAQKRVAELESALLQQNQKPAAVPALAAADQAPASPKSLPHDLRPPPKSGTLFHPDWDLRGLPCQSADQVVQAWESVYNVQLSLEGYPSQYCSAYLAVLKEGRQKRLYFLFSLKKNRHTLVCIPSQRPEDDAALRKAVTEGQKYLKKSGFELEPIAADQIAGILGGYFQKD